MLRKVILLTILFFLLVGSILSTNAEFSGLQRGLGKVLLPFLRGSRWLGQRIVLPTEKFIVYLQESQLLEDYKETNVKLRSRLAAMQELKQENEFLKQGLDVKSLPEQEKILVDIIGYFSEFKGEVFLINAGSRQGIKKDQPVVSPHGVLIGKVFNVYKDFSKVAPITNKAVSVAVKTQDSGVEGILEGRGKENPLVFDLISYTEKVGKETVVTSGLDQVFMPGLVVGEIQKVEFTPQESSQRAYVNPFYSQLNLRQLLVVVGQSEIKN